MSSSSQAAASAAASKKTATTRRPSRASAALLLKAKRELASAQRAHAQAVARVEHMTTHANRTYALLQEERKARAAEREKDDDRVANMAKVMALIGTDLCNKLCRDLRMCDRCLCTDDPSKNIHCDCPMDSDSD
jgi:hypothetical protein